VRVEDRVEDLVDNRLDELLNNVRVDEPTEESFEDVDFET
jgi:hypothetical protein